jgi:hypothetical protein
LSAELDRPMTRTGPCQTEFGDVFSGPRFRCGAAI